MGTGTNMFLLGELARAETAAHRAAGAGALGAIGALNQVERNYEKFVFRAKSHVHGLRAQVYSRQVTEDALIAALKAENANHPLASKEAVEAAVEDARARALLNPEVIKRTYPDGKLPEGAVYGDPIGVQTIA